MADFNYKLIKNILSNNYFIGELEKNPAFVGKTCLKDVGKSVPYFWMYKCTTFMEEWKSISNYKFFLC